METKLRTENKMGTMPVGRLLANMALPMVISMLVQALYNVVDSVYVSRVSENALTGLSNSKLDDRIFHRRRRGHELASLQMSGEPGI